MATRKLTKKPKYRGGRPSGLKDEYIFEAKALCANGAGPSDLAQHFGVHRTTIYRWQMGDDEFRDACQIGWEQGAKRAEGSLMDLAMGVVLKDETVDEEETEVDGKLVRKTRRRTTTREMEPKIQAICKIIEQHSRNFTVDEQKVTIDIVDDPEHAARSFITKVLEGLK